MDRFMFKITVGYPTKKEELEILQKMSRNEQPKIEKVISKEDLLRAYKFTDSIFVDEKISNYIVEIVMATREPSKYGLGRLSNLLSVGGSPRATISLIRAAKAHAFIRARGYVTVEDVRAIAYMVLRHRLILTYEAEAENVKTDDIIKELLNEIEVS